MRILCAFLALVVYGLRRQILIGVSSPDVSPHRFKRAFRYAGRIRAHISDQAHRSFAEVDTFVKFLRQRHRFLGCKPQLANSFLLELAGDERRDGVLAPFARFNGTDLESGLLQSSTVGRSEE